MMVDETEHGSPARTRYRVLDRAGNRAAWVELHPLTGRTHQLRVHMAAIGHPIVGDGKYGGQDAFLTGSISRKMHLHARRLIIDHPDGAPLDVTAQLPEHFAASMVQLGFEEGEGDEKLQALLQEPADRGDDKAAAKAHAKQYRKERRGERRNRSEGGGQARPARMSTGPKPRPGPKSRPGSKPQAGARPGARPAPKPRGR
jgi:23S rRNA pseudouridine955/2504/2580 synthase